MSKNKIIALTTAFLLLLGLVEGKAQSNKLVTSNDDNTRLEIINTKSSKLSNARKIASNSTSFIGKGEENYASSELRTGIYTLIKPGYHVIKRTVELTFDQFRSLDYFMQIEVPDGYEITDEKIVDISNYIKLSESHQVDYVDVITFTNTEPVIAELVYDNEKKNSMSYRIPGRLLTDEELKEYGLEQYIKTK